MKRLWNSTPRPLVAFGLLLHAGCGNNPYAPEDAHKKIYYGYLINYYPLDPVNAQAIPAVGYLGAICEPLFEYHYLKQPRELRPLLARAVPTFEPITEPGGSPRELYRLRFEIWDGVLFHRDVCFDPPDHAVRKTRELTADDYAFTFMRIADPVNNCPAFDSFARIDGLAEWSERLAALRRSDPAAAGLPMHELYDRIGPIPGVRVTGRYRFDLVLTERFPILLYWLAFCFAAPTPHEAVEYYNGESGRRHLREWPIGTGPYRMAAHQLSEYLAFEKNPDWRGITQPERRLPGTVYPSEGAPGDGEAGLLDPAYAGRALPFIDRFEYRREKEPVSRFGKFLQGFYDAEEVEEQTFNQAVGEGQATPALRDRGVRLNKQTELRIWYFAFNMNDDIVGAPERFADPEREKDHALWIERNRKLRQAMNLAYDTSREIEIFRNGRSTKAESPIPPGLLGYDPDYRNPFRQYDPDLAQARQLLAEAGYPNGIDPKTGRPLRIVMSVSDTDPRSIELFKMNVRQFGRLGIDIEIDAVTENAFKQKMRNGAFQLLRWGWYADYPDPQTFLILLYGPECSAGTGRVNKANFRHPRFDFLYEKMIPLANDESATWTETDEGSGFRVQGSGKEREIERWRDGETEEQEERERGRGGEGPRDRGPAGRKDGSTAGAESLPFSRFRSPPLPRGVQNAEPRTLNPEARAVTMTRGEIIREMIAIFEYECPWIINHHPQTYALYHAWYRNVKPSTIIYNWHKYRDIDVELRARQREAWNRPVAWPAYVLAAGLAILLAPAIRIYIRRTQR